MRQTQTQVIDGITFEVTQLPWKEARAVLSRAVALFGPALAELLRAGKVKNLGDLDTSIVAGAAEKFAASLSDADLEFFYSKFESGTKTQLEGSPMLPLKAAVTVFDGRLMLMYRWMWFCCEVNFADFLGGLRNLAPSHPDAAKASESPFPTS